MEEGKRLLIFLHLYFEGDVNKILKELVEKNICFSKEEVDRKLENIRPNAYTTYFDDDYPEEWKDGTVGKYPLVIEKN